MSKITLFDISERYLNIEELLNNPDIPEEVLVEALNSINEEFSAKADNIVKFIKIVEGDCEVLKKEEARLAGKRRTLENKSKRMKQYLEDNMRLIGNTKFKTTLFSYNIQSNPPSLEIKNEDLIPDTYKTIETVVKIDKKQLLKDIKEGLDLKDAVELKNSSSLRIR